MIDNVLLADLSIHDLWYAAPLVVAISLVYAATRHEVMAPILRHALGCGTWIVGLLIAVGAVMAAIDWWL